MKHLLTLAAFAVLFGPAPAHAQPQPEPKIPDGVKPARMEGTILTSTGQPVRGAEVHLRQLTGALQWFGDPYRTLSDDNGKFVFENVLPSPRYGLVAEKAGYSNGRYGKEVNKNAIVAIPIKEGAVLTGVSVTMDPQGVISGRVLDPAGDPVKDATVYLLRNSFSPNGAARRVAASATTKSDDRGEYRFAGLQPGQFYVGARITHDYGDGVIALPTFYPSTTHFRDSPALDLSEGKQASGIDVRLEQGQAYAIRGVVAKSLIPERGGSATIQALPRAAVEGARQSYINANAPVRPDGTFELTRIVPDDYVLEVVSDQTNSRGPVGTASVLVSNRDVDGVVVDPIRVATLTGHVTVEGSTVDELNTATAALPPQNHAIFERGGGSGIEITLNPLSPGGFGTTATTTVGPDGSFKLENVMPGRYYLNRPTVPGAYLKSIHLGGKDVTHAVLDIEGSSKLNLVFSTGAVRVSGSLKDSAGKPIAAAFILLWPLQAQPGLVYQGSRAGPTDNDGNFGLPIVAPGTYYAAALLCVNGNMSLIRDLLDQFNGIATKVEVKENVPITIDPIVISAEDVQKALAQIP